MEQLLEIELLLRLLYISETINHVCKGHCICGPWLDEILGFTKGTGLALVMETRQRETPAAVPSDVGTLPSEDWRPATSLAWSLKYQAADSAV